MVNTKMRTFLNVQDLGDLQQALAEAQEIKRDRFKYVEMGRNKTALLVFFNNSLRTRLSTQKAALNLGMNVIVLDVNAGAWKLETERGVVMDGDNRWMYCDILEYEAFASIVLHGW